VVRCGDEEVAVGGAEGGGVGLVQLRKLRKETAEVEGKHRGASRSTGGR
jgi:hypothetical protein